ncbi:uncharacterized protein LOC144709253 [Wolffia australiana]
MNAPGRSPWTPTAEAAARIIYKYPFPRLWLARRARSRSSSAVTRRPSSRHLLRGSVSGAVSFPPMAKNTFFNDTATTEIYTGDELCRQKTIQLLEELNMPRGLLPIQDVYEIGINRRTGFVWLRQKQALNYTFRKAGRLVSFGAEVTGFVEDRRMRQVTGVKSKELLMWISLGEFYVNPKDHTKITFRTPAGLSKTYPASAFELEEQGNTRAIV